ncbi:hypothetical protein [Chitinimonas lacunae]
MIDEGGVRFSYDYDALGNQISEKSAQGKDIVKQYDAAGHLTKIIDQAQPGYENTTTYLYDALGRKIREIFDGWSYSAPDHPIERQEGRDTSYRYDEVGRLVGWFDLRTHLGTRYQYDEVGNRQRVYETNGQGVFDHHYSFDGANRVKTIHQGGELLHAYDYDRNGNRVVDIDKGVTYRYWYDSNNRVTHSEWQVRPDKGAYEVGYGKGMRSIRPSMHRKTIRPRFPQTRGKSRLARRWVTPACRSSSWHVITWAMPIFGTSSRLMASRWVMAISI